MAIQILYSGDTKRMKKPALDDIKTPARYLSSAIVSPPLPMTWPATLLQVDS